MSSLLELISSEASSGIDGLTGVAPLITNEGSVSLDVDTIAIPSACIEVDVSGDANGKMEIYLPANVATVLSDMMLGGEGESKDELDEGDLDASKEIISTILGAVNTTLAAGGDLASLKFDTINIKTIASSDDVDFSTAGQLYDFDISMNGNDGHIYLMIESSLIDVFENDGSDANSDFSLDDDMNIDAGEIDGSLDDFGMMDTPSISSEEMANMNLIMDVKLPIKVRIGSKKMLLKDVINMDIGAIIELDRLVNDPLDILVDDKIIGVGEVVIVDGNFGIQVSEIGSQRDRIEAMR